ncbi:hypothetical protein EZV62_008288 [Acer yangbiense]|uniref:Peptidase A1 domain-containing protein n=1 Tax=Acer yangbiense TaxID=1000413 RepID=A0A5C7ICH3_9ROSI|nr:hypothetical protein EZV62_008288 [Acer yangbiense]
MSTSISTHNNNSAMHPSANARPEVLPIHSSYMVRIGIGELEKEYWLLLDTGSGLTWIQCQPCISCYSQVDPIFDPKSSDSFRKVSCNKAISCNPYYCNDGQCIYKLNYGDRSSTSGYIASENFFYTTQNEKPFFFSMKFGCSPVSRAWKAIFLNKFSYCLVDPNTVTHSYLKFGDDAYNGRPVQEFNKTPFVSNPFKNNYYLNLQDISFNGNRLNLPEDTFKIRVYGRGGCIIDSGTPFTRLKYSVYIRVKDEFEAYFARYGIQRSYVGCGRSSVLCLDLPSGFNAFPSMTYHFFGADLHVEPENVFRFSPSHFAPAIVAGDTDFTILGSWQQHNYRFIYDTDLRQLSFAPEECDKDNP